MILDLFARYRVIFKPTGVPEPTSDARHMATTSPAPVPESQSVTPDPPKPPQPSQAVDVCPPTRTWLNATLGTRDQHHEDLVLARLAQLTWAYDPLTAARALWAPELLEAE